MPQLETQTGFWVDWTQGPIYGPSITLRTSSSNALIAIASLWVGNLVAGWIWSTVAPLIYYWRNKTCRDSALRDGVHVQHQLVWRNVGDPLSAAMENFAIYRERSSFFVKAKRLWKALRDKAAGTSSGAVNQSSGSPNKPLKQAPTDVTFTRIHRRTCAAVLLPFLIFAGFFVAGVFVSFIAKPQHDVLVASSLDSCGLWNFSTKSHEGSTPNEVQNAYVNKVLNDTLAARTYSRSCYSNDVHSIDPVSCSFFTKSALKYSTGRDHKVCPFTSYPGEPFEGGACDTPLNYGSFVMFTGELDSSTDFGMNAHHANAIQLQKNVTCSVLSLTNRTGQSRLLNTQANTTYSTYLFGAIKNGFPGGGGNVTAFVNVAASQSSYMPFSVMAVYAEAGVRNQDWSPSPPLARPDGDTSLFFLTSNDIVYQHPVHDPWFYATDPTSVPIGLPEAADYFAPVNPVAVMGCVDQYVLCNKRVGRCTEPGGVYSLQDTSQVDKLDFNLHQWVTAERVVSMLKNTDTFTSVYGTGSSALKASDTVIGVLSAGLPPNQWELEAEGWFQTSLAKMQAYTVEYASNSQSLGEYGILHFLSANKTTLPIWHSQCFSQRVGNPGQYQIFSLLGLLLLLCFGILFFIAAQIVACFVSRDPRPEYAADDKFELQRMVLNAEMLSKASGFPVYKPSSRPLPTAQFDHGSASYPAGPLLAKPAVNSLAGPSAASGQPHCTINQNAAGASQDPVSTTQTLSPSSASSVPAANAQSQGQTNQNANLTSQGSTGTVQTPNSMVSPASALNMQTQSQSSQSLHPPQPGSVTTTPTPNATAVSGTVATNPGPTGSTAP